MDVDGDAAAVVMHRHAVVRVQRESDAVAEPGHRLVDRVVDDLVGEVVQPALVGAPDVHAGAPAHRLQPFEDLDVAGCVPLLLRGHAAVLLEGRGRGDEWLELRSRRGGGSGRFSAP